MESVERHGGALRVISCALLEVSEGTSSPCGIVVMPFPTRAQARAWKDADYLAAVRVRHDRTETDMLRVNEL